MQDKDIGMQDQDSALAEDDGNIPAQHGSPQNNQDSFLAGKGLLALLLSLSLANFFAGFDATCVATIAPIITTDFHSLNDVSWYGIAYSLATCATTLPYGKLYTFFPMKVVFSTSIAIFVVGSILCAAAQYSSMFIVGRAVAGLGNGGILAGSNIIIAQKTPLNRRPIYMGIVGGIECFALAVAPLLAGAIARYSSWRVCFYISIPCGIVAAVIIILIVPDTSAPQQSHLSLREKFLQLDIIGMMLFIPSAVCLVLALQWGGIQYTWSNPRIVALLSLSGVFAIAFASQQWFAGAKATVPPSLFDSWTLTVSVTYIFSTSAALYVFTYYTPLFYQVVLSASTLGSGVRDLSRMLALVISLLLAGKVTAMVGYYNPTMIIGGILMAIGAGLTTTFDPEIALANMVAYQGLFGLGCGFAFQQAYVAAQLALPTDLIPAGMVLLTFTQFLGNIIALAVAQNLFINQLVRRLATEIQGVDAMAIVNEGALSLRAIVPEEHLQILLYACSDAIRATFYLGLGFACATAAGACSLRWRSVKIKSSDEATEKKSGRIQILRGFRNRRNES